LTDPLPNTPGKEFFHLYKTNKMNRENLIAVHAAPNSETVIRFVEFESLSVEFQDSINSGRCYGIYGADDMLFMNDNDGNEQEQY